MHNSSFLASKSPKQNDLHQISYCSCQKFAWLWKVIQLAQRGSNNTHYPKLISASQKKKNPTLHYKRCYKNGQCHESRYQCVQCEDKPPLCVDPCFMLFLDLIQYFLHLQKVTAKTTSRDRAKILAKSQNALKSGLK